MTSWPHDTVLRDEVVLALDPADGEVHVDVTLGAGGHAEALLEAAACTVLGIDRDPSALSLASERLARFGDRFRAVHGRFGDLTAVLRREGVAQVDGIVADLGVSSMQLDRAERGFSFRAAGPVDMRMDPSSGTPLSAWLDATTEAELTDVIRELGEERHARKVARVILDGRPWTDTAALAAAVADAIPTRGPQRIHPATRTFQALRIQVNDELGELDRFLDAVVDALRPGGRLAVIAFHSLEDRRVKRFIARESGRDADKDAYGDPLVRPRLRPLTRLARPQTDDPNPRARSARLRTAVRLP